ncbi:MAG: DinB family protein [Chloroflexota bacterium]
MSINEERVAQIEIIRLFPARLKTAVSPLTPTQLVATPIAGEWSIAQIVHHCGDAHMNGYIRLKLMLTEDNPPIKPYAEADWGQLPDANNPNIDTTLTLLDGLHPRWVEALTSLSEVDWTRTGVHGYLGQLSVADIVETYAKHCQGHLAQIEQTRSALTPE